MSKWTQEQRDKACMLIFTKAGMPHSAKHLSDAAMEVAIELACQRNELLEALKAAEKFVDRHSEEWYAPGQELLASIRAAIAKAEGK